MSYLLSFSKTFRTGALAGLTVPCRVGYAMQSTAVAAANRLRNVVGVVQRDLLTHDEYFVSRVRVGTPADLDGERRGDCDGSQDWNELAARESRS